MAVGNRVSTGISGLDDTVDMLRLGDNVVWQVGSVEEYLRVINPYVKQAKADGRRLVYFRFGSHEPLLDDDIASVVYKMNASEGFESFATKIYNTIECEGTKVFYVFDCLSDLLQFWYSDLMIGNFFRVTCPFLFQLDTIAYFALLRGIHTHATIARIRETTQLLLDIYNVENKIYVHPLKVWERYSPTMFFPHLIDGEKAVSITNSADASLLFSGMIKMNVRDNWEDMLDKARKVLHSDNNEQAVFKKLLIGLIIGKDKRITELASVYFTLHDLLEIASREIGTGFIGGKSVGMLLARKIIETKAPDSLGKRLEPHDSYYIGADVFYTYVVQNGWWKLRCKQKTSEGYFTLAPELREKLLTGKFPDVIREQFLQMLEHFGQSPVIVRSSSLLEDNFGNAFAGKYESIFCANQGPPETRFEAFEQAVRAVYASTMSDDALLYRKNRGLAENDEQMAILVQRVSGDHYGDLFFPHIAGVGNSRNLYVWNKDINPNAGMLRLVFGLGTRAVDRVSGDYARIVALDSPEKGPPVHYGDEKKFSQHKADVLNLRQNNLVEIPLDNLSNIDIKTNKALFGSVDYPQLSRLSEHGIRYDTQPLIYDFKVLLAQTEFPACMGEILSTLQETYNYPVDIEFSANFNMNGNFLINLLQCRPLQTKGLGKAVTMPEPGQGSVFFSSTGNFMGGNIRLALDYIVFVKAPEYLKLTERDKHKTARQIGIINQKLKGSNVLLAGPGRWGTTTPSLGVPVHFSELSNISVLCEISYQYGGLMPELSFGSHFFQDIVETGIFYAAIFDGNEDVIFNPENILSSENIIEKFLTGEQSSVIHIVQANGLTIYSDIAQQRVICGKHF